MLTEKAELIVLSKKLLAAINMLSSEPFYIVQPGLSIIKDHVDIINRLKLFDDEPEIVDIVQLPMRGEIG